MVFGFRKKTSITKHITKVGKAKTAIAVAKEREVQRERVAIAKERIRADKAITKEKNRKSFGASLGSFVTKAQKVAKKIPATRTTPRKTTKTKSSGKRKKGKRTTAAQPTERRSVSDFPNFNF